MTIPHRCRRLPPRRLLILLPGAHLKGVDPHYYIFLNTFSIFWRIFKPSEIGIKEFAATINQMIPANHHKFIKYFIRTRTLSNERLIDTHDTAVPCPCVSIFYIYT